MAKSSSEAHGAEGRSNLLFFDPQKLVLVTDKGSPLYDARVDLPVDESMVLNIMYQGVIEPVVVCKNRETGNTEVVAGRQRVRAAREANVRLRDRGLAAIMVPGIVKSGKPGELIGFMVSENEIRRADTPLGRAEKMQHMLNFGKDEAAVATVFGCSEATVKTHLTLLECCTAVRNAVEAGKIGIGHAKALAKMEPAQQREKLAELVAAGDGAGTRTEKVRKQREALGSDKPKMKTRKEILAEIEENKDAGEYCSALRWALGESIQ